MSTVQPTDDALQPISSQPPVCHEGERDIAPRMEGEWEGFSSLPTQLLVPAIVFSIVLLLLQPIPDSYQHLGAPLFRSTVYLLLEDVACGVLVGTGIALLAYAIVRQKVSELAPGHWVAIAAITVLWMNVQDLPQGKVAPPEIFAPGWLVQIMLEHLTIAVFFVVIGASSRESGLWRFYAWMRAGIGFVCFYIVAADYFADKDPNQVWSGTVLVLSYLNFAGVLAIVPLFLVGLNHDERQNELFRVGLNQELKEEVKRDVWHWVGIGLAVFPAIPFLLR